MNDRDRDAAPSLLERFTSLVPLTAHLGIELTAAAPEEVRGRLAWARELCTSGGVLHGGVLMAFADTLGATCAFLHLPEGATTSTIESKTNFFRPVLRGHVDGVARPLNVGKTVIVVETDLLDDQGKLVARVTQSQIVRRQA